MSWNNTASAVGALKREWKLQTMAAPYLLYDFKRFPIYLHGKMNLKAPWPHTFDRESVVLAITWAGPANLQSCNVAAQDSRWGYLLTLMNSWRKKSGTHLNGLYLYSDRSTRIRRSRGFLGRRSSNGSLPIFFSCSLFCNSVHPIPLLTITIFSTTSGYISAIRYPTNPP